MEPLINKFAGQYNWLSNFHPCVVLLDGVEYPTTEHAYQAAKTIDLTERAQFIGLTAGQAKRLGKEVTLRSDWKDISLRLMYDLNYQKFYKPEFREKLLATGNAHIEEGNNWGDTFWGTVDGVGENHLGKIIMHIREDLKDLEVKQG